MLLTQALSNKMYSPNFYLLALVVIVTILDYSSCNVDNHLNVDTLFNATNIQLDSFREGRRSALADSCITNDQAPGTCMTRFSCMRQGGTPKGFCGTYGVCCETNLACGAVSKLKRTIVRNPPQLLSDTCRYTFEAYSPNVCQLLIQFQTFELQQPQENPVTGRLECGDQFVAGTFILCGLNSQQHIYLPFNVAGGIDFITLAFNLPNRWPQSNWRLVVTQLECPVAKRRNEATFMPFINQNNLHDLRTIFSTHNSDLDLLAPPGCDQYYTEPQGNIRSFNFNSALGTRYMSNLNYAICIKPLPGATMIEYTFRWFSLSAQIPDVPYDNNCHGTIHTEGRREDYLMIPQSMFANMPEMQPTYYCGTFQTPNQVIYASAPFLMVFVSDDITGPEETGFNIDYRIRSVL